NWAGEYTVQITETPNPDQNTPDEEWLAIGIVIYADGDPVDGHLRHRFNIGNRMMTGLRILTPDGAVIDELELYPESYVPPPPPALIIDPEPGFSA
ncbi:MAG: hypothetical protein GWO24_02670, partial [Akkermansiaceae bacterium]|nr:hypothetical protein [Akkermansiaceae bacterium]